MSDFMWPFSAKARLVRALKNPDQCSFSDIVDLVSRFVVDTQDKQDKDENQKLLSGTLSILDTWPVSPHHKRSAFLEIAQKMNVCSPVEYASCPIGGSRSVTEYREYCAILYKAFCKNTADQTSPEGPLPEAKFYFEKAQESKDFVTQVFLYGATSTALAQAQKSGTETIQIRM